MSLALLLVLPVSAAATDYICIVEQWAGAWIERGSFGVRSAHTTPSTYFLRKRDGKYQVFNHKLNAVQMAGCNDTGTFCDRGDDLYGGMFMRDEVHNTFVLIEMRGPSANEGEDRSWHVTLVGKCSEM
ncbi:MAG: hypothetical protein AAFX44_15640 [Pseudomonadota bacterium]